MYGIWLSFFLWSGTTFRFRHSYQALSNDFCAQLIFAVRTTFEVKMYMAEKT